MGVNPWGKLSNSTYDDKPTCVANTSPTVLPNPKPNNFRILASFQFGNYLLLSIEYPDCTNYEGKKILVYKDCDITDLMKQWSIDPHFSENKAYHSPVARFVPSEEGWQMAQKFIQAMRY